MLVHIQFGIEVDGDLYGWYKKELYKLPQFRKLKQQLNNTSKCYYISREKCSMVRLKELTKVLDLNIEVPNEKDLPF